MLPKLVRDDAPVHWIVDDTGFPKKGKHSVGVARQYCGQTGKQDNCRVAVSLSIATAFGSLPVGYRLYLPGEWTEDPARCEKAGVPEAVDFETKPALAMRQIEAALAAGYPRGVVLADAAYGDETAWREQLAGHGDVCGGRTAGHDGVVGRASAGQRAEAGRPSRQSAPPTPAGRRSSADFCSGVGAGATGQAMADGDLAQGGV